MKNQVQLIAYTQRLGEGTLHSINTLLENEFSDLFGTVHILPFYTPIDGADMGFDPTNHQEVDSRLGSWDDIQKISQHTDVMTDYIVNHISADSTIFKDYMAKGKDSKYSDLFLTYQHVFPNGATEQDLAVIYRPRPGFSFTFYTIAHTKKLMWTTFTNKQIDINVHSQVGKQYLENILSIFAKVGIKSIRMDAVGYAVKKAGGSCFMTDDTFEFIDLLAHKAKVLGIETLVEVHSYYGLQIEISKRVDWVYDFALPPLILHTLYAKNCTALARWLEISPRNCINVLDTHDGIGIIDVGPHGEMLGLLTAEETDRLVNNIHNASRGESRLVTGAVASNLDLYQINCTFYDALARNDQHYLWARALQFFAPGIPQVYYVGLLAGTNEMELFSQTKVGRDINRGVFDITRIRTSLALPVVQSLCSLIKFRNQHPSFQGDFSIEIKRTDSIRLAWTNGDDTATLDLDIVSGSMQIAWTTDDGKTHINAVEDIRKHW